MPIHFIGMYWQKIDTQKGILTHTSLIASFFAHPFLKPPWLLSFHPHHHHPSLLPVLVGGINRQVDWCSLLFQPVPFLLAIKNGRKAAESQEERKAIRETKVSQQRNNKESASLSAHFFNPLRGLLMCSSLLLTSKAKGVRKCYAGDIS